MFELLLWPLVAGLVLTGIHAYFGLHVLARGVVFVDLSLAQVAALGLTAAILAGHSVQSEAGYWYAFAFATGGGGAVDPAPPPARPASPGARPCDRNAHPAPPLR